MAGVVERLAYLITADGGDAIREFKKVRESATSDLGKVDKQVSTFGSKMKSTAAGVAAGVGGVFAAQQVAEFGSAAIEAARQAEIFRMKTKTVFGDSAGDVRDWANDVGHSFGMTANKTAGLAANFGDLLVPMGFTREQAAQMSTKVVGLAGALAAWSGGTRSAAEVSQILAKAMLGERDSLKELGISILDSDVKARLAKNGQDKLTGALLEQAKAVATQELIFEKSADAQKAWADGSMDAVKAQNELNATIEEFKLQAGKDLQPTVKATTKGLLDLTTWIGAVTDSAGKWDNLIGYGLGRHIRQLITGTDGATQSIEENNAAFTAGKFAAFEHGDALKSDAAAITGVSSASILAARDLQTFSSILASTAGAGLDLADAQASVSSAADRVAEDLSGAGDAAGGAAAKVYTFQDAMHDTFDSLVDANDATLDYLDSVDSLNEALHGTSVGSEDAAAAMERLTKGGKQASDPRAIQRATNAVVKAAEREVDAMVASGEIADTAAARKEALRQKLEELKQEFPEVADKIQAYEDRLDKIPNLTTKAETSTAKLSQKKKDLAGDIRDLIRAADDEAAKMEGTGTVLDKASRHHQALLDILTDLKSRFPELAAVIQDYVNDVNDAYEDFLRQQVGGAGPSGTLHVVPVPTASGSTPEPSVSPIRAAGVNVTQHIYGDGLSSKEVADWSATRIKRVLVGSRAS